MLRVLAFAFLIPLAVGCKQKKAADDEQSGEQVTARERSADDPPPPEENGTPAVPISCDPKASPTTCVGDSVHECQANGVAGTKLVTCDGACRNGACAQTCALHDAELIYVIDSENNLMRFDPRKLPNDPFEIVATLSCSSRHPFSMAVDRNGIAWVLYDNGALFRVSIVDGHCSHDFVAPQGAPRVFGMGFVADNATTPEHLMTSNAQHEKDGSTELAELDVSVNPPVWHRVGAVKGKQIMNPELTGTGDGQLYGYSPETTEDVDDKPRGRGFVQQISRTDGTPQGTRWQLPGTALATNGWAFAHYAGVFYVFVTFDDNSMVYAVHRKTGKVEQLMEKLPHRIVGAGVSTCAPLLEAAP